MVPTKFVAGLVPAFPSSHHPLHPRDPQVVPLQYWTFVPLYRRVPALEASQVAPSSAILMPHATSSFAPGLDTQIPILPVDRVVFTPSIPVPYMIFPIFRVLETEEADVSIS